MKPETRHTILALLRKFAWLLLLLIVLEVVYRLTWYPKELKEDGSFVELVQKAKQEQADILYLAESSNITCGNNDTDTRFISDMLADKITDQKLCHLTRPACHAGNYYKLLQRIPKKSATKTVIVTVNMRSFSSEWIYSKLETPLQREMIYMKKAPALYKRSLIAFKAFTHWSEAEREQIVRDNFKKQTFHFPYDFPYKNAYEWDYAIGTQCILYNGQPASLDTIQLACHYIKCFAYELDKNNPRIKDLDKIVKLCKRRGWNLVFNILPDNVDQVEALAGADLVYLMRQNANYIVERYSPKGVLVVNNQDIVRDCDFRERDFPTEHYLQNGRQAVANALYENMSQSLFKVNK